MYFTLPFDLVFYIRMTPFFVAVNLLPWSAVPVKAYCKSLPPYLLHHRAQMFDCTCAWDPFRCNVFFFCRYNISTAVLNICNAVRMLNRLRVLASLTPFIYLPGHPLWFRWDETFTRHNCLPRDAFFVWRMAILFDNNDELNPKSCPSPFSRTCVHFCFRVATVTLIM